MGKRAPWTKEEAAEMARKSHEARAANKAKDPTVRAVELVRTATPALMGELLKAAKGEEVYENLTPAQRLQAIIKALEYGVGRPTAAAKGEPEDAPPTVTPETLFGAEPAEEDPA